uniref:Uncharacterized protein n=1 Tax=Anguilla anguilla TaxID=7936 RepID=A0A0E9WQU2_ANGAN
MTFFLEGLLDKCTQISTIFVESVLFLVWILPLCEGVLSRRYFSLEH